MKAWKYLPGLGLIAVLLVAPSSEAKVLKKSVPDGGGTYLPCDQLCRAEGKLPIGTGFWNNDFHWPFYPCAGKTPEDIRPGYQLPGKYDNKCVVGWANKEYPTNLVQCFCCKR